MAAQLVAKGEARAVKRVGVTLAANQSRAIAQIVNLKVGTIKGAIRTVVQPTPDAPRLVFEVRAKGIPLKEFGARQTRGGVSVAVLKGGPRALLKAAFQLDRFGGNFFGRAGTDNPKRYSAPHVGRLPIVKLYGPNVLSQYIKDSIQKTGADTWNERLPIELERETNNVLRQAGLI
jgi:hypothetical protein